MKAGLDLRNVSLCIVISNQQLRVGADS